MTDSTNLSAEIVGDSTSTDELNSPAELAASEASEAPAPAGAGQRVQLAQAVVDVPLPQPGQTVVVQAAQGQTLHFLFDPATATSSQENGDLVLQINGGEVIIEGWEAASSGETPVEITNADGTVINMADFLVAIGLPPGGETEPAAGGGETGGGLPGTTPNQGAGFTPGQAPSILGGLGPEGPVDPTALSYRVPEREPFIFDIEEEEGGTPDAQDDGNGTPGTDPEAFCVDEENLLVDGGEGGGSIDLSISGNVLDNDSFGPDGPGGITGIQYAGDPADVTVATVGDLVTFTHSSWVMEFNLVTGDYTFTLTGPYSHGAPGEDEAFENFTYTIVDANGDTDSANLQICIKDDVPTANNDGYGTGAGEGFCVDEESLVIGGGEGGYDFDIGGGAVANAAQVGVAPVEGTRQFLLTVGNGFDVSQIESYFGLSANTLRDLVPGQETENGGAMKTEVTVSAGDTLSFSFNFLDGESPGQTTYMDLAVVVIGDQVFKLADVNNATTDGPDGLYFEFDEQTGYLTFNYVFPAGGTFQLGFAVMNEDDEVAHPGLLIDDIVITGPGGDKFVDGFEDGAANWDVLGGVGEFPGGGSISGNVLDNDSFGADGAGSITGVQYAGDAADVTVTTAGDIVTIEANDGSWVMEFDLATGEYTFTLTGPYDHSAPGEDDQAFENFTYTIVDADGDTAEANLQICIKDDEPTVEFAGGEGGLVLDESVGYGYGYDFQIALDDNADDELDSADPDDIGYAKVSIASLTSLDLDFGADGPGSGPTFALTLASNGVSSGLVDTASGNAIFLFNESGVIVGREGGAGGDIVFTIEIDGSEIEVHQYRAIKHDDAPDDHDESDDPESIAAGALNLTVSVTDNDGDAATDSIDLGQLIGFEDDGPSLTVEGGEGRIVLDETDGDADDGALGGLLASKTFAIDGLLDVDAVFGSDGEAAGGGLSYALSLNGAASGLIDAQTNQAVVLTLEGGQIVGRTAGGGLEVFRVSVDSETGEVTVTQSRAVEHDDSSDPDEAGSPESILPDTIILNVTATDGDGDTAEAEFDLGSRIEFEDDGPTAGLAIKNGAEIRLDESVGADPADPNADDEAASAENDIGYAKILGSALFTSTATFGSDGPFGGVPSAIYSLGLPVGDVDSGLIDVATGQHIFLFDGSGTIYGLYGPDAATAGAGFPGNIVFTVNVGADTGDVTVHQYRAVQHDNSNDPDESGSPEVMDPGKLLLVQTVSDGDGDSNSASVDLGSIIKFEDDGPGDVVVGGEGGVLRLDETLGDKAGDINSNDEQASAGDANDIGFAQISLGAFFIAAGDFGSDGPGAGATYDLTLSSNGAPSGLFHTESNNQIFLFEEAGVIVAREGTDAADAASGTIVFTVSIVGGNIEVHQYEAIRHNDQPTDHDEADDPESIAPNVLKLEVSGTDGDGDPATGVVDLGQLIRFEDDGPTATLANKTQPVSLTLDESVGTGAGDGNATDEELAGAHPDAIGFATASAATLFNETAEFGQDGAATGGGKAYELVLTGGDGVASGMVDAVSNLPVVLVDNNGVIEGRAGGELVFTIAIDESTGQVTVNQFRAVEHDDAGDHDESASPESIDAGRVGVKLTVTDGDGDQAESATAELGSLIKFEDDGPAWTDGEDGTPIRLDETDNDSDDGAVGGLLATRTVSLANVFGGTPDFGSDGPAAANSVVAQFSLVHPDTGLIDTLSSQHVILEPVSPFEVVGKTAGSGAEVFRITIDPVTGAITVTQSRAVEHDDPNDADEATTPETIQAGSLILKVTATDGDGDFADATVDLGQLIKFEDDGPTFDAADVQNTTVDEDDLPGGTDGGDSLTVTGDIGVDFGSDGPGDVTAISGPAGLTSGGQAIGYVFDSATNTLFGSVSGKTIFEVKIDPATGEYSFTLHEPLDHDGAASKALAFNFTVTDGDDDPISGSFTVDVTDDGPAPVDDEATVGDAGNTVTNLVIVFDRSGSMDEDSGVDGYATRMDLARAAVAQLMNSYDTFGPVNIKIVDFASGANSSIWFTGEDAVLQAIDYLAGLTPDGNTNYAAAVEEVQDSYAGAPAADQQFVYFLSDGNPTQGGQGDPPGTENDFRLTTSPDGGQLAAWQNFLTTNNFDTAFAVGVGAGVTNINALEDIAFPNVANDGNPVIVTNEAQLLDTLVETVGGDASGNVLTNDSFGADGPDDVAYVASITIEGDVYEYDPSTGNVTKNGAAFGNTTITEIATEHGKLTFNFATGQFTYEANNVANTELESFAYKVVDGDGTEATADLIVTINDVDTSVIARDDRIVTNVANGNSLLLVPAAALLFNDFVFDGGSLTISDVVNAAGGTVGLVGGNVQFSKTADTGSFDYTASNGSGSDDAHVTITTDASGALDGSDDREILIANNSGGTINALAGSDVVIGGSGSDTVDGGAGADMIMGGAGTDTLTGGSGGDYLDGGDDGVADTLTGGTGDDILVVWTSDIAHGGDDSDIIILKDNVNFGTVDGGLAADVDDNGNTDPGMGNHRGDILVFDGTLDLTAIANGRVQGIETVSMREGDGSTGDTTDVLTLNVSDVISMGTGSFNPEGTALDEVDTIRVDGNSGDILNLTGGGWSQVTPNPGDVPTGYNLWVHDGGAASGIQEDAYVLVQTTVTVNAS